MKSFIKNIMKRKLLLGISIAVVLLIVIVAVTRTGGAEEDGAKEVYGTQTVSVLSLINTTDTVGPLELVGTVEAAEDVDILPEASGVIQRILKEEGDTVVTGEIILELENADERIAVEQAAASLESARLTLQELVGETTLEDDSTLAAVKEQQNILIQNAKRTLLNNDLRAYSAGSVFQNPGELEVEEVAAPIISGTYNSEEEGEYVIEIYGSNSESGLSFRYSGLEEGTVSAALLQPTALGAQGLQVQLPDAPKNKLTDTVWTVPIPNTRSSSYFTALNAYEAAVEAKDVAVKQTEVQPEALQRQESTVRQQELALRSAEVALAKTIIRSPISGTLTTFDHDVGDFVNLGGTVASIKNLDNLEVVTFVTEFDRLLIQSGASAKIKELVDGVVVHVGDAVDLETQKIKVRIAITEDSAGTFETLFTEGETAQVAIDRSIPEDVQQVEDFSEFHVLPLSALQVIGTTTYVFIVDANSAAEPVPVDTGALLGADIVITDGLQEVSGVIEDARGIKEGEVVAVE